MMTKSKHLLHFIAICLVIISLLPQNILIAGAATNAKVFGYSPMLEEKGYIYYIQTVEGDKYTYNIYRLEVATGNKTKLISSKNDILNMMLHKDSLYYVSYDGDKDAYNTYSVPVAGGDKKTVCSGSALCLTNTSMYYTAIKGKERKLYQRDYNGKKSTLIFTGNATFSFIKKLNSTLYFTQFNEVSSKLTLYKLTSGSTKLTVLTTDKITSDGTDNTNCMVSDIAKINGDIYYQYGAYEGSGSFWYGSIIKLNSDNKTKSVIVKQSYEAQIYHNNISIFYNGTDSSEEHFQYNTKTGKTSTYIYRTTGTESFNILGDKTYSAIADGKESITVSRFTSGTKQNDSVNPLINITYKQNSKYDYSANVKKYGDYLLIPVTCMDYNDPSYGWRGKCVSIIWYVADLDGKILAQFQ